MSTLLVIPSLLIAATWCTVLYLRVKGLERTIVTQKADLDNLWSRYRQTELMCNSMWDSMPKVQYTAQVHRDCIELLTKFNATDPSTDERKTVVAIILRRLEDAS